MLTPTADTVRVFLHVLAAMVWVGGQLTLLGLLSTVRTLGPDAPSIVARRFGVIAWSAFAVLVATGIWNLLAMDVADTTTRYQQTLMLKLVLAVVSGAGAALHSWSRSKAALAIGGSLGLLGALGATFVGLLLSGA